MNEAERQPDRKKAPSAPPSDENKPDETGEYSSTLEDTQARSDTIASEIHPDNVHRKEQEREQVVDENINTDPATLEETGEVYSPPGPSVTSDKNRSP